MLWHVWFQAVAWISHTTPLTPPSYEVGGIAKRIKPLAFGEKPNPVGTWYFTSSYNCDIILNINHLSRMRSIASLPCKIVLGDLIQPLFKNSFYHQGFFAVKRRAVFILGAMWWALVRGWRSDCALCYKAVFYVFVFDSIHDSATLHNLYPGIFHWTLTSNF